MRFGAMLLIGMSAFAAEEEPASDEIEKGHSLVYKKCAECHTLKRVFRAHYDETRWQRTIDRMIENNLEITPQERTDVVAYLVSLDDTHDASTAEIIGSFHFMLVHFPIGLWLSIAFFEVLFLLAGFPIAKGTLHGFVRLAVLLTLPTVAMGYLLIREKSTIPELLAWHRNFGILVGVLAIATWGLRERAAGGGRGGWVYRLLLLTLAFVVGVTGHLGGVLVHGDFLGQLIPELKL